MIKEQATVTSITNDYVVVETHRKSTCGSCAAKSGCGSAALSEVLGQRRSTVRVLVDSQQSSQLQSGNVVTIELKEKALLTGSFVIYGLPILLLLLLTAVGQWLAQDLGAVIGLSLAVVFSFFGLRLWHQRIKQHADYQPSLCGDHST